MAAKVLSFAKPNPANPMSPPPPQPLPPKKEVALALLERSAVNVYLDPRSKNVIVPPGLAKQPRLVLEIGLNMPVPIPDLRLDDDAMSCTLSFNRKPFLCVIPWTSVFAMVGDDSRGMVWPDDVPPELANEGAARTLQAVPSPPPSAPKAVEAAAETAKPATKAKRTRKKAGAPADAAAVVKEEAAKVEVPARPAPVAVPARAPAPRALPQPAAAASPAPAPNAPSAPSSPHAPSAIKRPGAGKPKRELPPYLRVVK